ncbi:MAG: cyclic nucleotide-binding domain-containing protein [Candidatus Omnitrophica bacterium]|nr:MAG: cAMP receptor protein [Candidatus Hinthialibacteria bacterium OLB16]MBE7487309.1 cyclic nucleotide-binding domain-containing protein [bacterium]MBW7937385.1 cyclic nucleotide-binding domain-containing protein [Candidatus Omnitrophota bacterium]MCE7907021.1 cyclic nucleotide-binding domain-containing protein [Candidatus Omnitrophica bacterium COP1]MBV6480609.1 hypothetical protein [bacterium]
MINYTEILKNVSIFAGLDEKALAQASLICTSRTCHEDDVVFIEHTEGSELFIILKGEVSITLELASEEDAMPLVTLRKGDVFGELAVVDESPRSATARCLTDCEFLVIEKADLDGLMESDHDLGFTIMRNMVRLVSQRVRSANQRILDNVSWGMI